MSTKAKKSNITTPDDPDPTPINTASSSEQVQGAVRTERKRMAGNYGRTKTILAGNNTGDNSIEKTILGG